LREERGRQRKYVAHAGSVSSLFACGELQPTHPRALFTCVDCFDFVPSTCLWRAALISRCPHGPRARISGGLLGLPPRWPESALFFTCAQLEPGFLSVRLFLSSQRPKVSCALLLLVYFLPLLVLCFIDAILFLWFFLCLSSVCDLSMDIDVE